MEADALLEGLNEAQRRAVTSPAAPLCILAGAGSGKTRVLTRRIAHRAAIGSLEPRHALAITFTRKAGSELTQRMRALGLREAVTTGTFHSIAYAQLRVRWADRGVTPPALLERKVGFVARLLARSGSQPPDSATALDVVTEIEWAKARMHEPGDYPSAATRAGRRPTLEIGSVAEVFDRYEAEKRARRLVDFDDLLRLCRRDLLDDRTFQAAQHWRFRHLFVDEFQDVNPLQHALLEAWLGERTDVCIVGDPAQAIYSFNGAQPTLLGEFADRHRGTEVIRLEHNYRSTPQIIAVANSVLAGARGPARDRGPSCESAPLRATRPAGVEPTIASHADDVIEAEAIAKAVRDRRDPGKPWATQAVLARTNAQVALLAEAFREAQVPFRIRGDRAPFDRSEADATQGDACTGVDQVNPSHDAVELSTFHAAKGLEWPIVHLAGIERGLVPIAHARTPDALAEERRLFYVAVTRAEQELHITWARQRTFGSRAKEREPSPYLEEVEDVALATAPRASPAPTLDPRRSGRATLAQAGRSRRTPSHIAGAKLDPATREVLDALKAWRSTRARAADVPAYVIFHDSTLEAVAAASPCSRDDLLALPGLGPIKVNRYGDELLHIVAAHAPV